MGTGHHLQFLEVEAVMVHEALVLRGKDCPHKRGGYLFQRDPFLAGTPVADTA